MSPTAGPALTPAQIAAVSATSDETILALLERVIEIDFGPDLGL